MPIVIKVENVSKAYRLGVIGTGTLGNDLKRWYALTRGKKDPFLKIGETNDRTVKGKSDVVWSLKDINFEIEQGDAVGIIGKNGAGKSTLLKILSRVTGPTTGKITGNGRVASLLEVGTGFHPELTGRDNIYLNGAILGMRKKEIKRKFDEIVDFSGVERYIDTPVKRYSSGMYVRLAFAVAAYLESEILIVDEVLAVGDMEFQRKCLGKMNEVSKGEGRTVLFVSHNMEAVLKLCKRVIYLNNGYLVETGRPTDIIGIYLKTNKYQSERNSLEKIELRNGLAFLNNAKLLSISLERFDTEPWVLKFGQTITLKIGIEVVSTLKILDIGVALLTIRDFEIASSLTNDDKPLLNINAGKYEVMLTYKNLQLLPGGYKIGLGLRSEKGMEDYIENVCEFEVLISELSAESDSSIRRGVLIPEIFYKIEAKADV